MYYTVFNYGIPVKVYTQKDPVSMEKLITEFHEMFYITKIQTLDFHFPHVCILRNHHCGKECHEVFKI